MWKIIYEKAIREDGSLFFPQELSREFLDSARKSQGIYIFSNQYLNEVIPEELQTFRRPWIKYFSILPSLTKTFAFIDPALSQEEGSDYTAYVVVDIDTDARWYVRQAARERMTPTQIVNLVFDIKHQFNPEVIGIEDVAFQKALIYMVNEEMERRKTFVSVYGLRPSVEKTKEMRIRGTLVPRFEFGRILLAGGLMDLEKELLQFPRGTHDDIIDALAYIQELVYRPTEEKKQHEAPATNSPDYERWYIRNKLGLNRNKDRDSYED